MLALHHLHGFSAAFAAGSCGVAAWPETGCECVVSSGQAKTERQLKLGKGGCHPSSFGGCCLWAMSSFLSALSSDEVEPLLNMNIFVLLFITFRSPNWSRRLIALFHEPLTQLQVVGWYVDFSGESVSRPCFIIGRSTILLTSKEPDDVRGSLYLALSEHLI